MAARIDSDAGNFETSPIIRAAHQKASILFAGDAINPSDFGDIYNPLAIKADKDRIHQLKEQVFELGSSKIAADILEGIIYEQIELADWFGPYAHTIKTSEFDDIVHGVDLIVEMSEPERSASHLALGVDATFGSQTIQKKFTRIKRDIDDDRLAKIKYFQSSDGRFKGQLTQVPRIVLGVDRTALLSLARMWTEGKKAELGTHPVQDLLLKQARSQLVTFASYAKSRHKHEATRSYETALAALRNITKTKVAQAPSEGVPDMSDDKVHAEILANLSMFD